MSIHVVQFEISLNAAGGNWSDTLVTAFGGDVFPASDQGRLVWVPHLMWLSGTLDTGGLASWRFFWAPGAAADDDDVIDEYVSASPERSVKLSCSPGIPVLRVNGGTLAPYTLRVTTTGKTVDGTIRGFYTFRKAGT